MHIHYYTFGAAQELYRTQWWGLKRCTVFVVWQCLWQ